MERISNRTNNVQVKARLRQIRMAKGFSQEDVAKYLKIDRTTYTRYETGKTKLYFNILNDLSVFFDVPIDAFFEEIDSPLPSIDYIASTNSPYNAKGKIRTYQLTFSECKVINAFRILASADQEAAIEFLTDLSMKNL